MKALNILKNHIRDLEKMVLVFDEYAMYKSRDETKKGIDNRVNVAVCKLDKNTEEIIEEYHSISEAARQNNLEKANISKICNNYKTKKKKKKKYKTKYQTSGGFKWKFKD